VLDGKPKVVLLVHKFERVENAALKFNLLYKSCHLLSIKTHINNELQGM